MTKRHVLSLFFPCLLAVCMDADAVTWQVGPGRAYTTPAALFDAVSLQPGDRVEVDGDADYASFKVPDQVVGTAQNPIVIFGVRVNGRRPHVRDGVNTVKFEHSHHVVFEAFEITGGSSRCVFIEADDVTLRDLLVHDCPAHGILSADLGSGSLTLEYSEIHHAGSGTTRHALYIQSDEVAYPGSVFRMRHNYVHDGSGGNLLKSRHERSEIYYNWFEGAAYHELELIGPDDWEQEPPWTPDLVREDADVVGNVIVHSGSFGAVIRVGGDGGDGTGESRGRTRFVNNTIVLTSGVEATVFRIFAGIQSVEAHNNVLHSTGGALRVERTVEADWVDGRQVGGSSNWVRSGASYLPAEWTDTIQGSDPGFVDLAAWNLNPAAGSPLLDAGDAAPQPIPGYPLTAPLFPPAFQPLRAAIRPGAGPPRLGAGRIDIGAFERQLDAIFSDGFES